MHLNRVYSDHSGITNSANRGNLQVEEIFSLLWNLDEYINPFPVLSVKIPTGILKLRHKAAIPEETDPAVTPCVHLPSPANPPNTFRLGPCRR